MPIDRKQVESYVEELGLSDAARTALLADLEANERAATQFVGQRQRHDDYTKKTQTLAQQRQDIESNATRQIQEYATQLTAADQKIARIMKDFEGETINRATAEARLKKVKETYALSDDDIPQVTTPAAVTPAQTAPTIDVDGKIKEMEQRIYNQLLAIPQINAVQSDIQYEHEKLTGKRLNQTEMRDLMSKAQKDNQSLLSAWESEYKIGDIRLNNTVEQRVSERLKEEDAKRIAAADAAALQGIRPNDPGAAARLSPVLHRDYQSRGTDPATAAPADKSNQTPASTPGARLSGAERAAVKYMERRNAGIPMGKSA